MLKRCQEIQQDILLELNPYDLNNPKEVLDFGKTLARSYARHRRGADEGIEHSTILLPRIRQKMAGFIKVLPEWLEADEEMGVTNPDKLKIEAYDVLEKYIELLATEEVQETEDMFSEEMAALNELAEDMAALAELELSNLK